MTDQNRFGPLQMRVRRHRGIAGLFRAIDDCAAKLAQFLPQLIDCGPHIQPQVGRNLLIAAASAVQLVAGIADQRGKLLLNEVVNVFRLLVFEKSWRSGSLLRRSAPVPEEC